MSHSPLVDCGNGVRLERGVKMRMRDGVTLVSDHYYPAGPKPQPTLLMRQPYGRDIASTVVYAHPVWFARHGYNVVIQDVRGRGASEGEFYPFRHEAQDGFDTLAALRQRPECDGSVGMYGFSYQGMTQWLAAAEQPEGLKCIAPAQTAHDLYRGWFYQNGALRLAATLGWGLQMLKEDARRRGLHEASDRLEAAWRNLPAQFLETPYGAHPAIQAAGLPAYVMDWISHTEAGKYWSRLDVSERMGEVKVPALHLSGWYDTYLSGSVAGFHAAAAGAAVEVRDQQYLIAGPWVHIPWGDRVGGQYLGPGANLDTDTLLLRWFNHWLKGSGEFAGEPRIKHFALNVNKWHEAEAWPVSGMTLFLHSYGNANSSKGDGTLGAIAPDTDEPVDVLSYDPEVPVVAPGGVAHAAGPADQALLELGNNVLVYTGETLTEELHVFGSPRVEIHASTSAPRADVTAKLVLLKPSGAAMFLCIGVLRSQHEPDTPNLFRFELEPTSCVFFAGDRVRLEIASSAYPLFDRNPSTDVMPKDASAWNWGRSTQMIYHTTRHPSVLYLPLAQEAV